jgi:hypothetical protein
MRRRSPAPFQNRRTASHAVRHFRFATRPRAVDRQVSGLRCRARRSRFPRAAIGSASGTSCGLGTQSCGKRPQTPGIRWRLARGRNQHLRRDFRLLETSERSPENRGVPGSSPGLAIRENAANEDLSLAMERTDLSVNAPVFRFVAFRGLNPDKTLKPHGRPGTSRRSKRLDLAERTARRRCLPSHRRRPTRRRHAPQWATQSRGGPVSQAGFDGGLDSRILSSGEETLRRHGPSKEVSA